ncbi:MAG: hypothetical protein IID37_11685 [Planctomycetes bacterium]|nr:hypothetical protein [Planctomycetota bacterium]
MRRRKLRSQVLSAPGRRVLSTPGSRVDLLREQALNAKVRGQIDRALELGRRYLARRRDDPGALSFLAKIHHERGEWSEFLRYGLRSYEIEPKREHLQLLYLACVELERFDTAMELCTNELEDKWLRLLLTDPRFFIMLHVNLGRARKAATRKARELRRESARPIVAEQPLPLPPAPSPEGASIPSVAKRRVESPVGKAPVWPHGEPPAVPVELDIDGHELLAEVHAWGQDTPTNTPPLLILSDLYVKHDGITDRFNSRFQFLNCRVEILHPHDEVAEYLAVGVYYQAAGEELIDDVAELWINVHTRAVVAFPPQALAGQSPESTTATDSDHKLSAETATDLIEATLRKARPFIEGRLAALLDRRRHDLAREYHALDDAYRGDWEAATPTPGRHDGTFTGDSAEHTAEDTLREWTARRDKAAANLARDHTVHVTAEPIELQRLRLPVLVCTVRLTRRQASSTLPIVWNPLIKDFEPVPCTRCGRDGFTLGAAESAEVRCPHCL